MQLFALISLGMHVGCCTINTCRTTLHTEDITRHDVVDIGLTENGLPDQVLIMIMIDVETMLLTDVADK